MHYLVPVIVILGFSIVLTLGLLSVMQDLSERTAESPLIRENEASLVQILDDDATREWRGQGTWPAYVARTAGKYGDQRTMRIGRG